MITITNLRAFEGMCAQVGVTTPQPVIRGLQLHTAAYALAMPQRRALLNLTDDELGDVLTDYAVRNHTGLPGEVGLNAGLPVLERELLDEVYAATLPLLDDLVIGLQPVFDQVVDPIVKAVRQYGFTGTTTAEEVLLRRRSEDSDAFMAARDAVAGMQPLLSFRQFLSTTFDVDPWGPMGQPVDFSVAFAAGDNWSLDGSFNRAQKHPGLVNVIALAAGGLRLNTPSEVRTKLQQRRWSEAGVATDTAVEEDLDLDITPGAKYPVATAKGA